LIQQRLEEMMIPAVHERHVDTIIVQGLGTGKPGKTAAQHDYIERFHRLRLTSMHHATTSM
jgi:predicted TIM-barrel enzyme